MRLMQTSATGCTNILSAARARPWRGPHCLRRHSWRTAGRKAGRRGHHARQACACLGHWRRFGHRRRWHSWRRRRPWTTSCRKAPYVSMRVVGRQLACIGALVRDGAAAGRGAARRQWSLRRRRLNHSARAPIGQQAVKMQGPWPRAPVFSIAMAQRGRTKNEK